MMRKRTIPFNGRLKTSTALLLACIIIPGVLLAQVVPDSASVASDTVIATNTVASPQPAAAEVKKLANVVDSTADPRNTRPHVYRMNYLVSSAFCLVATAADIYAIPKVIKAKKDLTDAEVLALNPNTLNDLDRIALRQDPARRDDYYKSSDYVLPAIIVGAGALAFDRKIKKDWLRVLVMYYETHAVTFSLYNFSPFGPAFQNKVRPVAYYDELPMSKRTPGNNRNSMYSGHTASAAATTFFMVKVYSDYHPELGNRKYILYGLALIPPLAEGYLRVKALAHFPSDALIGTAIGAFCGITVPALHKFHSKSVSVSMVPTPAGPGLSLNWTPYYKKQPLAR